MGNNINLDEFYKYMASGKLVEDDMLKIFNSKIWDKVAEACL